MTSLYLHTPTVYVLAGGRGRRSYHLSTDPGAARYADGADWKDGDTPLRSLCGLDVEDAIVRRLSDYPEGGDGHPSRSTVLKWCCQKCRRAAGTPTPVTPWRRIDRGLYGSGTLRTPLGDLPFGCDGEVELVVDRYTVRDGWIVRERHPSGEFSDWAGSFFYRLADAKEHVGGGRP